VFICVRKCSEVFKGVQEACSGGVFRGAFRVVFRGVFSELCSEVFKGVQRCSSVFKGVESTLNSTLSQTDPLPLSGNSCCLRSLFR
jgi:hypothetical protein